MRFRGSRALVALVTFGSVACGGTDDSPLVTGSPLVDSGLPNLLPDAGRADSGPPIITVPTPVGDSGELNCLEQPVDVRGESPDMLIVLDKSLSMLLTRWAPSVDAVKMLTGQYQSSIRFGLSTYPGDGTCGAGLLDVPMAENNAQPIADYINVTVPVGVTPTAQSLRAALTYVGPRMEGSPDMAAARPASVLLVTDGEPTCPDAANLDPGQASVDAAAALLAAGIKVYVVGYQVGATDLMNRIAQAGGTNQYYAVEDGASLQAAFQDITKNVVRCDFTLQTVEDVPDPMRIYVEIDGVQRKISAGDWMIEGRRITLLGTACSVLKDGALHTVKAEQRCEVVR